jgi:hypothetical protein
MTDLEQLKEMLPSNLIRKRKASIKMTKEMLANGIHYILGAHYCRMSPIEIL